VELELDSQLRAARACTSCSRNRRRARRRRSRSRRATSGSRTASWNAARISLRAGSREVGVQTGTLRRDLPRPLGGAARGDARCAEGRCDLRADRADVSTPGRQEFMLADAQAAVLLTQERYRRGDRFRAAWRSSAWTATGNCPRAQSAVSRSAARRRSRAARVRHLHVRFDRPAERRRDHAIARSPTSSSHMRRAAGTGVPRCAGQPDDTRVRSVGAGLVLAVDDGRKARDRAPRGDTRRRRVWPTGWRGRRPPSCRRLPPPGRCWSTPAGRAETR
jgi:hypothetical protein